MPTPIGHSLAGYAAAKLTRVRLGDSERRLFLVAAAFGILPDVLGMLSELIVPESHHGFSHSLAGMAVVSVLTAWLCWRVGWRFWPVLLFVAAAYGSHLLADLLRPATTLSEGEQLLWPLSTSYALRLDILPHVPGLDALPGVAAWLRAVALLMLRELLLLGPVALGCLFIRPAIPARPSAGAPAAVDPAAA